MTADRDWLRALAHEMDREGILTCGFCGATPESHSDSDAGPMSVCPPFPAATHQEGTDG